MAVAPLPQMMRADISRHMSMIGYYLPLPQADLDALYADPSRIVAFLDQAQDGDVVDVDKAWHGMHFLLTGAPWEADAPLGDAVLGGAAVGEEDVGYGPARGLSSSEVKAVAVALAPIDEAAFRQRFDGEALAEEEIYPTIWDEGDEALDYLAHYYVIVRQLFAEAARNGHAMILYIS